MSTPKVFREGETVARGTRETPGMGQPVNDACVPDRSRIVDSVKILEIVKLVGFTPEEAQCWRLVYDVTYRDGGKVHFTAHCGSSEIDMRLF